MNEAILIYLYLVLGSLIEVMLFAGVIGSVAWGFLFIGSDGDLVFDQTEEGTGEYKMQRGLNLFGKLSIIVLITGSLLAVLYPDKDDLKWIIGGAIVWNGAETASQMESVQRLPDNLVNAANHFLESIEDTGDETTEE
jgi:hypothetical protein